ncbi:MAG: hypothetical protein HDT16_03505 [Oscillibacter sp.]|nr:hypothetical protein [Oscillibacter sp.]
MMKNLDVVEQEKREQQAAEELLSEAQTDNQSQPSDGQPDTPPDAPSEDGGGERMFTREEVQRIVSEAVARERVSMECREYLLTHYYGLEHVSDELDQVLRILEPKSVDDLAQKMENIEALDSVNGTVTHAVSTSPKSIKTSLRQIFGIT